MSDLHWAVSSPSLVTDPLAVGAQPINLGEVDPDHLLNFVERSKSHRVGRYFERLVGYWLEHIEKVDLLGHGVQLKEGKRTVGEIDFLFRDHDGVLNHWEAAVKFFLYYPQPDGSHYPGPNASDNFEMKTQKLFDKQLTISENFYPEVQIRRAFVRGSIFYRAPVYQESTPSRLAPDHQRGSWLRRSEIGQLSQFESQVGFVCPKPLWLSPLVSPEAMPMLDLSSELESHFQELDHPVMICLLDAAAATETARFFVVSDRWPLRLS